MRCALCLHSVSVLHAPCARRCLPDARTTHKRLTNVSRTAHELLTHCSHTTHARPTHGSRLVHGTTLFASIAERHEATYVVQLEGPRSRRCHNNYINIVMSAVLGTHFVHPTACIYVWCVFLGGHRACSTPLNCLFFLRTASRPTYKMGDGASAERQGRGEPGAFDDE